MNDAQRDQQKALRQYADKLKEAKIRTEVGRLSDGCAGKYRIITDGDNITQDNGIGEGSRRASIDGTRGRKTRRQDESHVRARCATPDVRQQLDSSHIPSVPRRVRTRDLEAFQWIDQPDRKSLLQKAPTAEVECQTGQKINDPMLHESSSEASTLRVPTFAHRTVAQSVAGGSLVHHRDTFAMKKSRGHRTHQVKAINPPITMVAALLEHADHQTYLALRLTCRSWSKAVDIAKPPKMPAVYKVPPEIIQEIYACLLTEACSKTSHAFASANNFNNARHTCRAWMAASLDKKLLAQAFLRAGW